MSSNVGLSTPRGSGTSGYVQRNLSHLRPRETFAPYPRDAEATKQQHRPRQPDAKILAHDRAREIEVKVFDLRDQLEDEGVEEDEIETRTEALRSKLTAEAEGANGRPGARVAAAKGLKAHQVHELAAAKIEESEKLRRALGISKDYEEGSHWKRQDERMRDALRKDEDGERAATEEKERESRRRS